MDLRTGRLASRTMTFWHGSPVLITDGLVWPMNERDYTNGEGVKLVGELLHAGATIAESASEAIEIARRYAV